MIRGFIRDVASLIAGLGVTFRAMCQPVVTCQYPREVIDITPRFRGHTKLLADDQNPERSRCTACQICVKNCPSNAIVRVEGEKKEGEKRKTATEYILDFTTCSQCGICVEVCPFDALAFSRDYNWVGTKREECVFDLVKELKRNQAQ